MKKRSTKEIKLQAKKSLQGHVGTVILGLLAVYGLNTLGTILFYQFVFWHIRAGSGSQRNIYAGGVTDRGNHFCWSGVYALNIPGKGVSLGDLGLLFKNQPDRVIVAGFVLAMIQLITAIPYYYVSFTTDPGLTVDSQIQWLSMTLGLLAVSTLLNFLFPFHLP